MFEHFHTSQELFEYRLGSALTMEHDSLDMLKELEAAAQTDEVKHLFAHHQDETEEQIANLEQCFSLLGIDVNDSPSPTTKGLAKEGSALVGKSDPALRDAVALSAALGTEHYEISAYQTLIITAEALGKNDVVALLKTNLQQEEHTSDELNTAAKKLASVA